MYLRYFIYTASIGPAYFVPQISAPYIKIGKSDYYHDYVKEIQSQSNWNSTNSCMVLLILKIALSACDAKVCKATWRKHAHYIEYDLHS